MQAWDTLFWFAVLVGMSGQLNSSGVISHFADIVGGKLTSMNMGWQPVFGLLNAAYFVLHYMFASQTAHVGALYAAFLAMMLSAGDASYLSCELTCLSRQSLSATPNNRNVCIDLAAVWWLRGRCQALWCAQPWQRSICPGDSQPALAQSPKSKKHPV